MPLWALPPCAADEPLGVGLLLLGTAAGAPFLPKLAQIAKGDLAFAVGLMVLLMVVTVASAARIAAIVPGVSVNPQKIAGSLFLLMLLPLAGALALRAWFPDLAAPCKPFLDKFSNLSLVLLVVFITIAKVNNVVAVLGTRGVLAGIIFIASGFVVGWLLGGPEISTRRVLALAPRNGN